MVENKLAVFGYPIAHSRSPGIHHLFARQSGIELSYERILVQEGEFLTVALEFIESGGIGFNVTLPCKGDAWEFADQSSPSANRCKAVNTVSIDSEGLTFGNNTDGPGLVRDLVDNLGWDIADKRVLVLGAGGAVRGVLWDLLQASPRSIHLYNRTASKALDLENQMKDDRLVSTEADDLEGMYDLIINGTSAGLKAEVPDLPVRILGPNSRCYDMVYGPSVTSFNAWCLERAGCEVADGLGMLVEQAALSFEIWFSTIPGTKEVISSLRKSL